jgi:hypothetical protein
LLAHIIQLFSFFLFHAPLFHGLSARYLHLITLCVNTAHITWHQLVPSYAHRATTLGAHG